MGCYISGIRAGRSVRPELSNCCLSLSTRQVCTTLSVLVAFSSLVCRSGFEASGGEASASLGCFKCEQLVLCIVNCISASVGETA